jgi:hypothetical protein
MPRVEMQRKFQNVFTGFHLACARSFCLLAPRADLPHEQTISFSRKEKNPAVAFKAVSRFSGSALLMGYFLVRPHHDLFAVPEI